MNYGEENYCTGYNKRVMKFTAPALCRRCGNYHTPNHVHHHHQFVVIVMDHIGQADMPIVLILKHYVNYLLMQLHYIVLVLQRNELQLYLI